MEYFRRWHARGITRDVDSEALVAPSPRVILFRPRCFDAMTSARIQVQGHQDG